MRTRLVVEGWRFIPHSFAIVNQFQCLRLAERPDIEIYHRDVPYWNSAWTPERGLLPDHMERALQAIPAPGEVVGDVVLRMGYPFDFSESEARRTVVFATCEFGRLAPEAVRDSRPAAEALAASGAIVITPSSWSQEGLIRSGIARERIHIVPHGVSAGIFRPATDAQRTALRRQLGWEGKFVFLHVGAMTPNKGVPAIIEALGQIADRYPNVILALKGVDSLYPSQQRFREMMENIPPEGREQAVSRMEFVGASLSFAQMATIYQAADAYVSPYIGEGFNLPVLEAAACGLPVICTQGGPTDDFTTADFALAIRAQRHSIPGDQDTEYVVLLPDTQHLVELMTAAVENRDWSEHARTAGPAHVAAGYTWNHTIEKLMPLLAGNG